MAIPFPWRRSLEMNWFERISTTVVGNLAIWRRFFAFIQSIRANLLLLLFFLILAAGRLSAVQLTPVHFGPNVFQGALSAAGLWSSPLYGNPEALAEMAGSQVRFLSVNFGLGNSALALRDFLRRNKSEIVKATEESDFTVPSDESEFAGREIGSRYDFALVEDRSGQYSFGIRFGGFTRYKYNGILADSILCYDTRGTAEIAVGHGSFISQDLSFMKGIGYSSVVRGGFSFGGSKALRTKEDVDKYYYDFQVAEVHKEFQYRPGLSTDAAIGVRWRLPIDDYKAQSYVVGRDIFKVGELAEDGYSIVLVNCGSRRLRALGVDVEAVLGTSFPIKGDKGSDTQRASVSFGVVSQHLSFLAGVDGELVLGAAISAAGVEAGIVWGRIYSYWDTDNSPKKGLNLTLGFRV